MTEDFSSVRGMVFDLDGTLADTLGAICEAMNMTMTHFGYPLRTVPQIRQAIGNGARMLVMRSMPEKEAEDDAKLDAALAHYDQMYALTYLHTKECYAGMAETVAELSRRGYILTVLSNKQDAYVKGLIDQLFPHGEMCVSLGQGQFPVKPDRAAPIYISEVTGIPLAEYVMIGDSDVDIKTARATGMKLIGCAWGFRGAEALRQAGAETVIERPEELLKIFSEGKKSSF